MTGAAVILSAVAAVLFWLGYALYPDDLAGNSVLSYLGALPVLVPLMLILSRNLPQLAPPARLIAALWPPLVLTIVMTGGEAARAQYITTFGLWAFGCAAFGAGLAMIERDDAQMATLALFPLGAALMALAGTLLLVFAPAVAGLALNTPYHFVIALVLCAVLVALADAASTSLTPPRERLIRALTGLMPLLGFLGTIAGIIQALANLPQLFGGDGADPRVLESVMAGLSTAFETTLVGLVGAALCSFLLLLLIDRAGRAE